MAPVAMVRQAYLAHRGTPHPIAHYGQGERLRSRGGGYVTTVAIGLLYIMFAKVYQRMVGGIKVGVILYRSKIG